ncbi:MAG: DUF5331 domain-containing protein [Leptolyngbya sp. IPPAS B-1204]|nr:hypothetical protein [Elainella sp. C42_A2020_010]RNJ70656.1 MAG: hypothetical protein EDM05_01330 [Leptolyngbya sp. IPPAS B-1204]
MNIDHLRKTLKSAWLNYYRQNRHWIMRLGVWVNCQDQRRPSASFILGVLSTLEPQLVQLLPLVVDLNSNPDRIVIALGLNFNPEEELATADTAEDEAKLPVASEPTFKMLPSPTSNAVSPAVAVRGKQPQEKQPQEKQPIAVPASGSVEELSVPVPPNSNSVTSVPLEPAPSNAILSRIVPPPPIPAAIPASTEPAQPTSVSDVQSQIAPAKPSESNNHSEQPLHSSRIPLDTAQLSAHELPDRGTTKTGRKRVRWD